MIAISIASNMDAKLMSILIAIRAEHKFILLTVLLAIMILIKYCQYCFISFNVIILLIVSICCCIAKYCLKLVLILSEMPASALMPAVLQCLLLQCCQCNQLLYSENIQY